MIQYAKGNYEIENFGGWEFTVQAVRDINTNERIFIFEMEGANEGDESVSVFVSREEAKELAKVLIEMAE